MAAPKVDVSTTDVTTDTSSDDTATTVAVTVAAPYQVRWAGIVYIAGETVSGVDADTAEQWERAGFVTTSTKR